MNALEKVLGSVTDKMAAVAAISIVACMGLVVFDVIKRAVAVGGVLGTSEVVALIAAVILSMGLGFLTFVRGHVAVSLLVDRFRPRVQRVFDIVNSAIALGFTIWLTRALFVYSLSKLRAGAVSGVLNIPISPFAFVITLSLALVCVVLIRDLLKAVIMLRRGGEE